MNKYLLIMVATIFLVACGSIKIHDDVNEEVAKDALQLMDVISKNVKKDILYEDSSSKDKNVVDTYYKKYIGEFSTKKNLYDGVDEDILIISNATAVKYKEGITLETEKEDLKESESKLKDFIKNGEGFNLEEKEIDNEEEPLINENMNESFAADSLLLIWSIEDKIRYDSDLNADELFDFTDEYISDEVNFESLNDYEKGLAMKTSSIIMKYFENQYEDTNLLEEDLEEYYDVLSNGDDFFID